MHQVNRHSEMLYEMDTKLFIMNSTLQHLMWNIDAMRYMLFGEIPNLYSNI